jgi:ribonucleotide reductase alpha subunit
MLGTGVGFNLQQKYVYELPKVRRAKIIRQDTNDADFIVPDSREGWGKLLEYTLRAHFEGGGGFSYSTILVRGKGAPIKSFGGIASGPEELCWGVAEISRILNGRAGRKLRPIDALDIMNIIGAVVVAGNVRRSAQLAVGDLNDFEFLSAKRWDLGNIPNWRSSSNNTVICDDTKLLPDMFWEGYKGNGEPYGLFNLNMSQQVGRTGDTQYQDLDVVISNPCVTGDTPILTRQGHVRIDSRVDTEVEVWNGFEWSTVTPRITGTNRQTLRISLSNGRTLTCTPNHKFVLAGKTETRKEAFELQLGDKLIKHDLPVIREGAEYSADAMYIQGFFSANGTNNSNIIWLYEPKFELQQYLSAVQLGKEYETRSGVRRRMLKVSNLHSTDKTYLPHEANLQGRLAFVAGLLDGDGCELTEGGAQITSTNKEFLLDLQLMLQTMGTDSKVLNGRDAGYYEFPNQEGETEKYWCNAAYRLCIGAYQVQQLKTLGLQCKRLKFDKQPNRDAAEFAVVTGIEEAGTVDTVYCFTEPKRNLGCFNGIVTGQCVEQSLENFETCCLAEIYLPNITSKKELQDVATMLYRVCKHSLALKCHHPETQEIVHKNMRMGIGITGYMQATKEQQSWLESTYEYLRTYDAEYSKTHGWPISKKLTTVKPSGTLSLLAGVTPGVHPGYAQYFKRRIRVATGSPLIDLCRQHGYYIEPVKNFDGTDDTNTMVVEFPCAYPEGTVLAKDTTAIQQLEAVAKLQREWSDNAVSCTVYYRPEELKGIQQWLHKNYADSIKAVSFLLHSEHGFAQAPYEEITQTEYEDLKAKTTPITGGNVGEGELDIEECEGGHCPIK